MKTHRESLFGIGQYLLRSDAHDGVGVRIVIFYIRWRAKSIFLVVQRRKTIGGPA